MERLKKDIKKQFWKLADGSEKERGVACNTLLKLLFGRKQAKEKEPTTELLYTLNRLIQGLASDRAHARHGYSAALTKIFNECECITVASIFTIIENKLKMERGLSKSEIGNCLLGKVMAFLTVIQTGKLYQADEKQIKFLCESLNDLRFKKPTLMQPCTSGLVKMVEKLPEDQVKTLVWPVLKDELSQGWSSCGPDTLLLLTTFRECQKNIVNKKFLQTYWNCNSILDEPNLEHIGKIFSKSTSNSPLIHPVCDKLLEKAAKWPGEFETFCEKVLNECLLHQAMPKKFLCLHLIHNALSHVSTLEQVQVLLSENLVALLMKQLQDKEQHIHDQARKLVGRFVTCMPHISDCEAQLAMVTSLLRPPGSVFFDNVTKSSTVSSMIRNLDENATMTFCDLIILFISGDNQLGHKESIDFEATLQWMIPTLTNTITQLSKFSYYQVRILSFFFLHGYFNVNKEDKTVTIEGMCKKEFSDSIVTLMQENFFRGLDKVTSFSPGPGENKTYQKHMALTLRKLCQYIQVVLNSTSVTPRKTFSPLVLTHWQKINKLINKLPSNKQLPEVADEDSELMSAFELLFVHLAFQLFMEPKVMAEALDDLYICYEKAFSKKTGKKRTSGVKAKKDIADDQEPAWIEVVTEVLLSLLSQNSHLLRTVVKKVYTRFCPHITSGSLQLIVQVLKSTGDIEDDDVIDFDDDDDNNDESRRENAKTGDEAVIKVNGDIATEESEEMDTADADSFSSGFSSDSESDTDSDKEEVSEDVKLSLKAALGNAAQPSDADESDPDLTDSEMEKLDATIASAFKSLKKGKKSTIEKIRQLKQFKMRCMDLIDILTQGDTSAQFLLELVSPLLDLLEDTQKEKDLKDLHSRVLSIYHGLVKNRKWVRTDDIEPSVLTELIQELFDRSTKVIGRDMILEVSQAIVFVINVATQMEYSKAKSLSLATIDPQNNTRANVVLQNSECIKSIQQIVRQSLQDYCWKRDNLLSDVLFFVLFERLPLIMCSLLPDIVKLAHDNDVRIFCRTKVCSLLTVLLNKNTVNLIGEEQWSSDCKMIYSKYVNILDSALEEDVVKPKFLQEVLHVLHNVVQLTSTSDIQDLRTNMQVLMEKTKSAKEKNKSKDIKVICNRLYNLISRRLSEVKGNKKRKREESGEDEHKQKKANISGIKEGFQTEQPEVELLTDTTISNMLLTKKALEEKKLKKQKKEEKLNAEQEEQWKLLKKEKKKLKRKRKQEEKQLNKKQKDTVTPSKKRSHLKSTGSHGDGSVTSNSVVVENNGHIEKSKKVKKNKKKKNKEKSVDVDSNGKESQSNTKVKRKSSHLTVKDSPKLSSDNTSVKSPKKKKLKLE